MSRKYELVYIVSPDATDAQVADLHTQVEQIVQRLERHRSRRPTTGAGASWPTKSVRTRKAPTSSRSSTAAAS